MRRDLTFIPFPLLFRAFICASFGKLLSLDFRLLLGSFLEWIVSLFQMSEMAVWYGLEPLLAADFSWQMCFVFLSSQTIRSGDFTDLQKKKKKKSAPLVPNQGVRVVINLNLILKHMQVRESRAVPEKGIKTLAQVDLICIVKLFGSLTCLKKIHTKTN